jgi:hypothetical protein
MPGKSLIVVPKRPMGRPSTYSVVTTDEICYRLTEGESLRSICRDDHMPVVPTVFNWLRQHEDFLNRYTVARARQAEMMVDDILDIADDGSNDWIERETKKGTIYTVVDNECVQRSRLRVEARKWIAENLLPTKYGVIARGTEPVAPTAVKIIGGLPD